MNPSSRCRPLAAAAGCLLLLALAGCTAQRAGRSGPAAAMAVMMFPECRDEIRGYVDLARLAASYDRNWDIFEDALDNMKEQVIDCVEDTEQDDVRSIRGDRSDPARRRPGLRTWKHRR